MSEAISAPLKTWRQVPTFSSDPHPISAPPMKLPRKESTPAQRTMRYARFSLENTASIFTYRASGTMVPCPLWIAPYAGRLLAWTHSKDGLLERIATQPHVQIAPCDGRGRLLAEPVPVTGRVLLAEELPTAKVAMQAKYGWRFGAARVSAALARALMLRPGRPAGLELTLD
ncbi:MAG: hypothetical protein HOQ05_04315 [Corynebacteriales bacterium]|nr:hypothetical protein [Mycobacteriales bacterium]